MFMVNWGRTALCFIFSSTHRTRRVVRLHCRWCWCYYLCTKLLHFRSCEECSKFYLQHSLSCWLKFFKSVSIAQKQVIYSVKLLMSCRLALQKVNYFVNIRGWRYNSFSFTSGLQLFLWSWRLHFCRGWRQLAFVRSIIFLCIFNQRQSFSCRGSGILNFYWTLRYIADLGTQFKHIIKNAIWLLHGHFRYLVACPVTPFVLFLYLI